MEREKALITTVIELLPGSGANVPQTQGVNVTFQKAPKAKRKTVSQGALDLETK